MKVSSGGRDTTTETQKERSGPGRRLEVCGVGTQVGCKGYSESFSPVGYGWVKREVGREG